MQKSDDNPQCNGHISICLFLTDASFLEEMVKPLPVCSRQFNLTARQVKLKAYIVTSKVAFCSRPFG